MILESAVLDVKPHQKESKGLLHHIYDPFPTVEHYEPLTGAI